MESILAVALFVGSILALNYYFTVIQINQKAKIAESRFNNAIHPLLDMLDKDEINYKKQFYCSKETSHPAVSSNSDCILTISTHNKMFRIIMPTKYQYKVDVEFAGLGYQGSIDYDRLF
jgi:hypothetical protein